MSDPRYEMATAYSTVGELYARNKLAAAFPLTMRLNGPLSIRKLGCCRTETPIVDAHYSKIAPLPLFYTFFISFLTYAELEGFLTV